MRIVKIGHEGLGTVLTRALALAAIAGGAGLAQAWLSKPMVLRPTGEKTTAPEVETIDLANPDREGDDAPETPTSPATTPSGTDVADERETEPETNVAPSDAGTEKAGAQSAEPDSRMISLEEAKSLFDSGAVFVDARLRADWADGRVLGAYQLTAGDLTSPSARTFEVIDALSAAPAIVIYCYGGEHCEASEDVAFYLAESFQIEGAMILEDGYEAWADAGYPIEGPLE